MDAMILAAGLGTRMRPLSDALPKPLLRVAGKPLIQHLVEALVRAGMPRIVVNHSRLGNRIEECLGSGEALGARLVYSPEGEVPLETGGGIKRALPLLDSPAFLVVNGDVWTDFDFRALPGKPARDGHLVLVANPPHHPDGDFSLAGGEVRERGLQPLTYSGICVLTRNFFADSPEGAFPLGPMLQDAARRGRLTGQFHGGEWSDVGSPERLESLQQRFGA